MQLEHGSYFQMLDTVSPPGRRARRVVVGTHRVAGLL